jgi:metallo-beta-lactamase family protein
MAIDATEILCKHQILHRLPVAACQSIREMVTFTRTVDESKSIASVQHPKIILSASGMLTGGRVLHHQRQVRWGPSSVHYRFTMRESFWVWKG